MPRGETINAAAYYQKLQRLPRTIQNNPREMLSGGVELLHGNARPHSAATTMNSVSGRFLNIHHIAQIWLQCDFHLFPKLNEFSNGSRYGSDDELKASVREYADRIENLVKRCKCLSFNGNYVEK